MKNNFYFWMVAFMLAGCSMQPRLSPVAGTQPADFSFSYEQEFPNGQPKQKTIAPQALDVRSCDISSWDLSAYTAQELADVLNFDSKTKFPPKRKLPKGFFPKKILKQAQNPGLGVRKLHKKGITGKGVSVAIMDQNLLLDHEQYADRIRYYWQDPFYQDAGQASMHGPAVTSILAGNSVGVAPQADIYYWAEHLIIDKQNILDAGAVANDLGRILHYNFSLDPAQQIRVVSISRGFGTRDKDYHKFQQAVAKLAEYNIAVFTTNDVSALSRTHGLTSPDSANYCRPASWWKKEDLPYYNELQDPLVPMDFRATAAPNGVQDYAYYVNGGLSWAVPYLAGLYALGVQVYPDLTKELFLQAVRNTAKSQTCTYQGQEFTARYFVNPTALVEYLQKLNAR